MIGQTISHYKILEKLGEGGMGVVYKAHDTKLHRTVALKFLPSHLAKEGPERDRFLHEAQAYATLNHPNITTIHEIDEADSEIFIAMELVEGCTLSGLISKGRLAEGDALKIAIQITDGLTAAHAKKVVHRDIKPGNILLTQDNAVKITDFGLAKLQGVTKLTRSGSTLGTAAYMSPEQALGETVDERSDIFSFGVVLFEMLSGTLPFRGEHEAAIAYSIVNEQPQDIIQLVPEISPIVANAIQRCLEKDPEDRYQTAQDIEIDLRRAQKKTGSVVSVGPSPRARSLKRIFSRRNIITMGIGTGIVVALAVIGWTIFYSVTGEPETPLITNRIVVAPFVNQTGDASFNQLSSLVTNELIQGLNVIDILEVVPLSATRQAVQELDAGKDGSRLVSEMDLGRRTKADLVVSGAINKKGTDIQIQANLVRTRDGKIIFTLEPATGPDEAKLIETLKDRTMGAALYYADNGPIVESTRPPNYAASQQFRHAMNYYLRSDRDKAITLLRQAIQSDSCFYAAYMWLAESYILIGAFEKADSVTKMLEASGGSLTSGELIFADWLRAQLSGDNEASFRAMRRWDEAYSSWVSRTILGFAALRLNDLSATIEYLTADIDYKGEWQPHFIHLAQAYHGLGRYGEELRVIDILRSRFPNNRNGIMCEITARAGLGETDTVLLLVDRGFSLPAPSGSDKCSVIRHAALELRAHGFETTADSLLQKAFAWYDTRTQAEKRIFRFPRAITHYYAGEWSRAKEIFLELARERPDDVSFKGYLGLIAAREGNGSEAERMSDWFAKLDKPYLFGTQTLWRARIAAALGNKEQAVLLLRDAFSQGLSHGIWAHYDPDLAVLRDYAPYRELMKPK